MDTIKNYDKYQNNESFIRFIATKIKLVKGNKDKVLNLYIPYIILFDLDENYFSNIVSNKWKQEDISYGLDESESFEGFELFIKDYMSCKMISLDLDKDMERYQTSLRFNKDIYMFDITDLDIDIASIINKNLRVNVDSFYRDRIKGKDNYMLRISLVDNRYSIQFKLCYERDWIVTVLLFFKDVDDVTFLNLRKPYSMNIDTKYTKISIKDKCIKFK